MCVCVCVCVCKVAWRFCFIGGNGDVYVGGRYTLLNGGHACLIGVTLMTFIDQNVKFIRELEDDATLLTGSDITQLHLIRTSPISHGGVV